MSIHEKYPLLIGCSDRGKKRLHNVREVAEFICNHGLYSDVTVTTECGKRILDTFGIYINKISDMEYREELLKVLIPMQQKLDGTIEPEYEDIEAWLNEAADEYLKSSIYVLDKAWFENEIKSQRLPVPSDEQIREELREKFINEKRKELECETNGHKWVETNVDPENGTSDLECENCGFSDTIRFS